MDLILCLCQHGIFQWTPIFTNPSFRRLLVQYHLLAHHLHGFLKYVDFSWNCFCHHKSLGFVDQYVFFNVYDCFSSQNSKLVYNFKSLSLNTRQGSGAIHITMLAPNFKTFNVMKSMFKTIFNHVLLSITFNDKF